MECKNCLLTDAFPSIYILEDGLCNLCHDHLNHPLDRKVLAQEMIKFLQGFVHRGAPVVLGVSGGKDSSVSLIWLRRNIPDLKIIAVTVDNGFCSEGALKNLAVLISNSTITWEILPARISPAALTAFDQHDNFCVPCGHSTIQVLGEYAQNKGLSCVILGREWLYAHDVAKNCVIRYDPVQDSFPYTGVYGISMVRLLAGLSMSLSERYDYLEGTPWRNPKIPTNTSCLLEGYVVRRFIDSHGYHPYILPISEQVRRGMMTYEEAKLALRYPEIPDDLTSLIEARLRPYNIQLGKTSK